VPSATRKENRREILLDGKSFESNTGTKENKSSPLLLIIKAESLDNNGTLLIKNH
jgi:hypothetical protein